MRQEELLRITEEYRDRFLAMKRLKLSAKLEQYAGMTVDLNILLKGWLEELGETLIAIFSKETNFLDSKSIDKINEELIDLSNQLDFLFAFINGTTFFQRH